jgi:phosphate transport system substrate-binding protein
MTFRLARFMSTAVLTAVASASVLAASGPLVWRGDVTVARGVVADVAKAWEKAGNGTMEVQSFNTASGLDAVAKGTADVAGAARPGVGAGEASLTFTPVAWDAVVMVTHASNPVSNITLTQLHDIYYGKITNWKELGGKDEPINLYAVASPADGVEFSLRKLLFGRGNQPVAAPRLYVNQSKLEEGVTLDTKGLGATTLAGAASNRKLKMLSIEGVAPSSSTVASGSYLLYTQLYLVTNPTSPKAADAKAFVDFVTSDKGKALLRAHSLLPYSDGDALTSADAGRRSRIASIVGTKANAGEAMTTAPTAVAAAAPQAPKTAEPSRPLTKAERLAAKKAAAKNVVAGTATTAEPSHFAKVTGTVVTTAKAGFVGITAEAITVSDQQTIGGKFAKVTADAITVAGKPVAKPVDASEQPADRLKLPKPAAKLPAAPVKKVAAAATQTYTVKPGDTLYSIAKKHAVDVAKVRSWNGLKGDSVRLGQTLKVSSPR